MKNKTLIFIALGILGIIAVGYVFYKKAQKKYKPKPVEQEEKKSNQS